MTRSHFVASDFHINGLHWQFAMELAQNLTILPSKHRILPVLANSGNFRFGILMATSACLEMR
ncbi:MAG: hypothetical protein V3S24_13830 [Candidatus Tectomicrobia bacterium]